MKVTRARTRVLRTPADNPLVVGIPVGDATREFVTLELDTNEGIQGIGVTFFGGPLTAALKEAVDALCQLIIGGDNTILCQQCYGSTPVFQTRTD